MRVQVAGLFGVVRSKQERETQVLRVSHLFTWLLLANFLIGVGITVFVSLCPELNHNFAHEKIAETTLARILMMVPALILSRAAPKAAITRHIITLTVMMQSLWLIISTGGRIEGHFSVFIFLAILAFYLDWKIFITALVIGTGYHCVLGHMNPMLVYGVPNATMWRCLEHGLWILYEIIFLLAWISVRLTAIRTIIGLQAQLQEKLEAHAADFADIKKKFSREIEILVRQDCEDRELQRLHDLERRHAEAERKLSEIVKYQEDKL